MTFVLRLTHGDPPPASQQIHQALVRAKPVQSRHALNFGQFLYLPPQDLDITSVGGLLLH